MKRKKRKTVVINDVFGKWVKKYWMPLVLYPIILVVLYAIPHEFLHGYAGKHFGYDYQLKLITL
ncbi:MAG: hypothetical protein V1743_05380, partial [Nanoarchaeota archaeon]